LGEVAEGLGGDVGEDDGREGGFVVVGYGGWKLVSSRVGPWDC